MKLLIDSVYLDLSKDTIPAGEWKQTKEAVAVVPGTSYKQKG